MHIYKYVYIYIYYTYIHIYMTYMVICPTKGMTHHQSRQFFGGAADNGFTLGHPKLLMICPGAPKLAMRNMGKLMAISQ